MCGRRDEVYVMSLIRVTDITWEQHSRSGFEAFQCCRTN